MRAAPVVRRPLQSLRGRHWRSTGGMAKDDMETCHDRGQRQGGSANCRWAETDTSHRWRVERWAGRPRPPRMSSSSCVSTCRRWVAWSPLAPKLDPSDGKLKLMSCCWTPGRVLGSSPSLDSCGGPRIVAPKGRPAHPTTRFRPAHLTESNRGVCTEGTDRGRRQGRKSLKPRQHSMI